MDQIERAIPTRNKPPTIDGEAVACCSKTGTLMGMSLSLR